MCDVMLCIDDSGISSTHGLTIYVRSPSFSLPMRLGIGDQHLHMSRYCKGFLEVVSALQEEAWERSFSKVGSELSESGALHVLLSKEPLEPPLVLPSWLVCPLCPWARP